MSILHLICSPRGRASQSFWLSQQIVDCLLQRDPGATVITRMIGDGSLLHVDALQATALGANQAMPVERFPEGSMLVSEELIAELDRADIVVISTPMHNFTVPSGLKAWIDHIVRVRRTFDVSPSGKIPLLRDRPIFVAVSSGARYSGERVRQPDFLTPYLKAILATIGLHDLRFFSIEGTGSSAERFAIAQARTEQKLRA
ncbi:MAG TPA: NAD(P)H-dependent oxidoreductase, partial [Devosia sp.]|nr:NAD(P)H-dependent oxidoreductase [Devosia sp.]